MQRFVLRRNALVPRTESVIRPEAGALSNRGKAMRCTKCGIENAADAKFCNQCAVPLSRACPECAHLNAPDATFCAECAEALKR
jgi:hypothetical protein